MHDGCVLRGTGEVKWPLLQSKLSLERPFDSRRTINYQSFVTSEGNVRNANAERYKSRQMTFFWINALLRRVCLVFCRFKLISVQQSQSHAFPTHTYTHNDSKSSWTSVQKWLSPFSNPARKLSVHSHTHTRVWASLKCRASSCSER